MGSEGAETCVRRRVEINGENYYLILGHDWVMATVPFENRPERLQERTVVEAVLGAVTAMLEERDERERENGRGGDRSSKNQGA